MTTREPNSSPKALHSLLSQLPAVTAILLDPLVESAGRRYSPARLTQAIQQAIGAVRQDMLDGRITLPSEIPNVQAFAAKALRILERSRAPKIRAAINGAGVILHTGLGRAPLPKAAFDALCIASRRYSLLALDQASGKRGDRQSHLEGILRELTGAEAALVVNNNAAAVLLTLTALADGLEAIVSRGELVEIGGSFRIPDVMARSGAKMVEVGTTNKTHLRDYEEAITPETALLLKVHTSNYRIQGFTSDVPITRLAQLAHDNDLPVVFDQGSGSLVDLRRWGLPYELTTPQAIQDGADIVTFSGDKLIGGPQCGIIVGKREIIGILKKHPLVRALRPDKLTLAALDGALNLFLDPELLPQTHPVYRMLTESASTLRRRAQALIRSIRRGSTIPLEFEVIEGFSEVGSGALPTTGIPTILLALTSGAISSSQLGRSLRLSETPVFTRIEDDRLLFDLRTIADEEVKVIGEMFRELGPA